MVRQLWKSRSKYWPSQLCCPFFPRIFSYCICADLHNRVCICMAFFGWKYESRN